MSTNGITKTEIEIFIHVTEENAQRLHKIIVTLPYQLTSWEFDHRTDEGYLFGKFAGNFNFCLNGHNIPTDFLKLYNPGAVFASYIMRDQELIELIQRIRYAERGDE